MTPFIGKERSQFLVSFQCGIASHKRKKKNPKPQNLGSTHPFNIFLLFSCLIKWFFYEDLSFILFSVLSSFYRRLVCRHQFIDVVSYFVLL